MRVELNKIFKVKKGNKTTKWKVIKHPYFETLVLIIDYCGLYGQMKNGVSKEDYVHICGTTTLERAYEDAFLMS